MSIQMALAPAFALVLLNFILMFAMANARMAALKSKQVRMRDVALGQKAYPERAQQISNAFSNQYEMPVLFFVLVAFAAPLRQMDLVMVLLAWVYVVTRYAHAFIYSTSNNINQRFMSFFAGALVLMAMWIYFALKLFLAVF